MCEAVSSIMRQIAGCKETEKPIHVYANYLSLTWTVDKNKELKKFNYPEAFPEKKERRYRDDWVTSATRWNKHGESDENCSPCAKTQRTLNVNTLTSFSKSK